MRMRKIYFLLAALFCFNGLYAQEAVLKVKDARIVSNTINGFTLSLDFQLDIDEQTNISTDYWLEPENRPVLKVVYQGKKNSKCDIVAKPYVTQSGRVGFQLSGFDEGTLRRFKAKDNQITVQVENNFKVQLLLADETVETRIIEKDNINTLINENLEISDEQREEYVSALNNFYYYTNHVDFGISPANTNSNGKTSYFLAYTFQNKYKGNIMKCSGPTDVNPPAVFWSSTGRVSTIFNDSLNFISVYPVNVIWAKKDYTVHVKGKLGHESNQVFTNKRVAGDVSASWVLPFNLINLTTAKDNRLRLKPIIDGGIKGYYDYSNRNIADYGANFGSGMAFLSAYYYIPVYNNYCIIFEGKSFYDFSTERNFSKRVMGNYAVTIGAEIGNTGFKAIFKYTGGKTDINYKEGKQVLLGLLMDFMSVKK